ncbi:MAG TPA: leucyl/phenylalanyl-tRNA--protein transferase [Nocardioidaceae bacterium]
MPTEPPPSGWEFPDSLHEIDDEVVGMGADLGPGTLLSAYRHGLFPMPGNPDMPMLWWSPDPRGILPLARLKVSRSLRSSVRRMEVRVDTAFDEVIRSCADPRRDSGWIDEEIISAYTDLYDLGWAHSVETWQDGRLVGGLYGIAIGGLFAGESMFHRVTDASKVALVGLVDLLRDEHADQRLLDVQWSTQHLASLGVVEVSRAEYLDLLRAALDLPLPAAFA